MTTTPEPPSDDPLRLLGSSLAAALDALDVPIYVIDAAGRLKWSNEASKAIFGDHTGATYLDLITEDERDRARERFARRLVGGEAGSYEISSLDSTRRRVTLRVHSAPLWDGERVVGIFGIAIPIGAQSTPSRAHTLTRRQIEVLRLLADGASTEVVAAELGIALETARNHIRALLRRLRVHSRVEAVAEGRRQGLLRDRDRGA